MSGSDKTYTDAQIEDLINPPDWFPNDHKPAPQIILHGHTAAMACGSCHLTNGEGHPESASLAGMPADYIIHQMADFKSGARKDAVMGGIAKAWPEEDVRQAAEWFAAIKPTKWVIVKESATVPKSYVPAAPRMRFEAPGGGTEPLGSIIIELPQDTKGAMLRDPRSGFIAYVPPGSVKRGERLVTTGGAGKTIACAQCHGDSLAGLGPVPRLAGLHTIYIVRQLYNFRSGENSGTWAPLMKKVVDKLTESDIIDIAAYASSLDPAP